MNRVPPLAEFPDHYVRNEDHIIRPKPRRLVDMRRSGMILPDSSNGISERQLLSSVLNANVNTGQSKPLPPRPISTNSSLLSPPNSHNAKPQQPSYQKSQNPSENYQNNGRGNFLLNQRSAPNLPGLIFQQHQQHQQQHSQNKEHIGGFLSPPLTSTSTTGSAFRSSLSPSLVQRFENYESLSNHHEYNKISEKNIPIPSDRSGPKIPAGGVGRGRVVEWKSVDNLNGKRPNYYSNSTNIDFGEPVHQTTFSPISPITTTNSNSTNTNSPNFNQEKSTQQLPTTHDISSSNLNTTTTLSQGKPYVNYLERKLPEISQQHQLISIPVESPQYDTIKSPTLYKEILAIKQEEEKLNPRIKANSLAESTPNSSLGRSSINSGGNDGELGDGDGDFSTIRSPNLTMNAGSTPLKKSSKNSQNGPSSKLKSRRRNILQHLSMDEMRLLNTRGINGTNTGTNGSASSSEGSSGHASMSDSQTSGSPPAPAGEYGRVSGPIYTKSVLKSVPETNDESNSNLNLSNLSNSSSTRLSAGGVGLDLSNISNISDGGRLNLSANLSNNNSAINISTTSSVNNSINSATGGHVKESSKNSKSSKSRRNKRLVDEPLILGNGNNGLEDIKQAIEQLTLKSRNKDGGHHSSYSYSTSTYSSMSGSECDRHRRPHIINRHSSLETINTQVTSADEFVWVDSHNRLVELQQFPWTNHDILKVIEKSTKLRDNLERISMETVPRISYLLQRALVRIAIETQRLSKPFGFCSKQEIISAFRIVLAPVLADSCIKACMKAASMFSLTTNDPLHRETKSSRAGINLQVGRFQRWMIEVRIGRFVHEFAAVNLTAGMENLVEEILTQALSHISNNFDGSPQVLTAALLEQSISSNGDLWGLLQPYAHLNAGRNGSGQLSLPRWASIASVASDGSSTTIGGDSEPSEGIPLRNSTSSSIPSNNSSNGHHCHNKSLEQSLLTTCVGSIAELNEILSRVAQYHHKQTPLTTSSNALILRIFDMYRNYLAGLNLDQEYWSQFRVFLRARQGQISVKDGDTTWNIYIDKHLIKKRKSGDNRGIMILCDSNCSSGNGKGSAPSWSPSAIHTLFYFMRCSQLDDDQQNLNNNLGSSTTTLGSEMDSSRTPNSNNLSGTTTTKIPVQELVYERPFIVLPPLIEWVRVSHAHAEHRHSWLVDNNDVQQAARLLLPGQDCPVRYIGGSGEFTWPRRQLDEAECTKRLKIDLAFKMLTSGRTDLVGPALGLMPPNSKANTYNEYGLTPLILSSIRGEDTMVRVLLDSGADADMETPSQNGHNFPRANSELQHWTAITFSTLLGHINIVKSLLEHGANVEGGAKLSEEKSTQTPLQLAVATGNMEMVTTLLNYGANPFLSTLTRSSLCYMGSAQRGSFSAISISASHGKRAILHKLLSHPFTSTSSKEILSLEEILAEGANSNSKNFSEEPKTLTKSQVKVLQEALYQSSENGYLQIILDLRNLGVPWTLHSWMNALSISHDLRTPVIDQLLQDFLLILPAEDLAHTQFIDECLPLLFTIFRNSKNEGTILLLADIFQSSFGRSPIKEVRDTSLVTNGTRIDPKYVNNPELSDVQFRVEGKVFYAHKIVLVTSSPRFKSMLKSAPDSTNPPILQINDIRYHIFQMVMEYLYNGNCDSIREIENDGILELMAAANFFQLDGLLRFCEAKCSQYVNVESFVSLYIHSKVYNAVNLLEFCQGFLLQNMITLLTYDDSVRRLIFGKKLQGHDVLAGLLLTLQTRLKSKIKPTAGNSTSGSSVNLRKSK